MELILYGILWYAIGCASFIYWWTRQLDFTTGEIGTALAVGILGPAAFITGWLIHGGNSRRVIIRKRD